MARRRRQPPEHAGSVQDQHRILRRIMGRAEVRQRDDRLDAVDRDLLNVLDRLIALGYGDGRIGVPVLATALHRTTRTVRRHLARVECLGYLEVIERQHGHGGPAVNRYRVLTPDRGPGGWARRREARAERDRARKAPRRGGVLTRLAPAHTRGRVNAPSGTGESDRMRPTVPVGQAEKRSGGRAMGTGKRPRGDQRETRRGQGEVQARWERMRAAAERWEAAEGAALAAVDREAAAVRVGAARREVALLVEQARTVAEERERRERGGKP